MKAPSVLVAFALGCICLTPAAAQHLDTLLYLSDTLGVLTYPVQLLANPLTGRVYGINDEADAVAFDPALMAKVRRFSGEFTQALFCPGSAKLYLTSYYEPQFTAVDARADTLLGTVTFEDYELDDVACSQTSGKLYVGLGGGDTSMAVIDVQTDSVVKWLFPELDLVKSVWDSAHDRLYVSYESETTNIMVLDCTTDSVVGRVEIPSDPYVYASKPAGRKLFCYAGDDTLMYVVDTDSMRVTRRVVLPLRPDTLLYNPSHDRLYALDYDRLAVVDGTSDSVRASLQLPYGINQMAVSPVDGRLYLGGSADSVAIVDAGDTIAGYLRHIRGSTDALGFSEVRRELYLGTSIGLVAIADVPADTIKGYVDYRNYSLRNLAYNPAGNKLYALMPSADLVCVLGPNLQVLKYINVPSMSTDVFPLLNPSLNRLYLGDDGRLIVIDCNSDSVIRTVGTGLVDEPILLLHPGLNRLFVAPQNRDSSVLVYDCLADTTIASINLHAEATCAVYQPMANKLYVGRYANPNVVAIDPVSCSIVTYQNAGRRNSGNDAFSHPANGLLYFANGGPDSLYVFDCRTDTLVTMLPTVPGADTIFWNSSLDKLYASANSATTVVDCRTNSVIDESLPAGVRRNGTMNQWSTKLYLDTLVLDCRNDTLVAVLSELGGNPYGMAWNPLDHRMFVARPLFLAVYSDEPVGIKEATGGLRLRLLIGANPVRGKAKLRCQVPLGQEATLSIVDVAGRLVHRSSVVGRTTSLTLDLADLRAGVYFAGLETPGCRSTAKFVLQR